MFQNSYDMDPGHFQTTPLKLFYVLLFQTQIVVNDIP